MRYSAEEHLHDLMAIIGATSHADLQRLLVMRPPALRGAEPIIPVNAFRRAHETGVDGDNPGPSDDAGPMLVRRDIPRGARRWAAERLIRHNAIEWGPMLARVEDLPSKQGAPMLLGLLDAADHLPEPAARLVDARAADSGDVVVRLAALRRIATYDTDEALRRGAADKNRRVRDWASAPALSEPPTTTGESQQPLF